MIATVTSKGQVALPAEARRQLKIIPGSKLEFIIIDHERLEVIPVVETISSLKGMVPKPKNRYPWPIWIRPLPKGPRLDWIGYQCSDTLYRTR